MNTIVLLSLMFTPQAAPADRQLFLPHVELPRPRQTSRMVFSPDGKRLATISSLQTKPTVVRGLLWIATKGELGGVYHAPYRLTVWDVETGEELFDLGRGSPTLLCFSDDGKFLVTSGGLSSPELTFTVWDLSGIRARERASYELKGGDWTLGCSISRDGSTLAVGTRVGTLNSAVAVWDLSSDKKTPRVIDCKKTRFDQVVLSPDGKHFATVGGFNIMWMPDVERKKIPLCSVSLWDTTTGQLKATVYRGDAVPIQTTFSADGTQLEYTTTQWIEDDDRFLLQRWGYAVSASRPAELKAKTILQDIPSYNEMKGKLSLREPILTVREVYDTIEIQDLVTGKTLVTEPPMSDTSRPTYALSPDGETMVVARNTIRLWRVKRLISESAKK